MEKNLQPEESLKIIERMLQQTRDNFKHRDAFHFLLWGWAVAAAALMQFYLVVYQESELHYLPWVILMPLSGVLVGIRESRNGDTESIRTFTDRVIAIIWMTGGLLFFAVVFAAVYQKISPNPFVLLVAGTFTIISGALWRFKLMIAGGIFMYCAGIACLFLTFHLQLILLVCAIIIGYLAPGYRMRQLS